MNDIMAVAAEVREARQRAEYAQALARMVQLPLRMVEEGIAKCALSLRVPAS